MELRRRKQPRKKIPGSAGVCARFRYLLGCAIVKLFCRCYHTGCSQPFTSMPILKDSIANSMA